MFAGVYKGNEHEIVNKNMVTYGKALKCSLGEQRGDIEETSIPEICSRKVKLWNDSKGELNDSER